MNQSEYARYREISPQRVSKYIENKQLKWSVTKKGRVYDIDHEKADREIEETLDPINRPESKPKKGARATKRSPAQTEGGTEEGGTAGMTYSMARTLSEQYRAALRKLEYDEKSGKLILSNKVARDADSVGRLIKERLIAIPVRIAPLVAVKSDPFECEQVIKKEINQILEELSKEVLR